MIPPFPTRKSKSKSKSNIKMMRRRIHYGGEVDMGVEVTLCVGGGVLIIFRNIAIAQESVHDWTIIERLTLYFCQPFHFFPIYYIIYK